MIIKLSGEHFRMGQQHGQQVIRLRPQILAAMDQRLDNLARLNVDTQPLMVEIRDLWEETARSTLEVLRGIADALSLEWEPFFRYTIASYLNDRALQPSNHEGCTAWAATGPITRNGKPILAKNRDYRPDHRDLQCLAWAEPSQGYRYTCITSAGSPGVFSSGMNECGLAIADTHVSANGLGPGVARYSVMMDILEHETRVESALDYLNSVTHIGDGTLVLLDATGEMAVFEAGHIQKGIIRSETGFVVSTNHYVSEALCQLWVDHEPPELKGNSQIRYEKVKAALLAAQGKVDVEWGEKVMANHGGTLEAICRHPEADPKSVTISSVLFLPKECKFFFADGLPCQTEFREWRVI